MERRTRIKEGRLRVQVTVSKSSVTLCESRYTEHNVTCVAAFCSAQSLSEKNLYAEIICIDIRCSISSVPMKAGCHNRFSHVDSIDTKER